MVTFQNSELVSGDSHMHLVAFQPSTRPKIRRGRSRHTPVVHGIRGVCSHAWGAVLRREYNRQLHLRASKKLGPETAVYTRSGKTMCAEFNEGEWHIHRSPWFNEGAPPALLAEVAVEIMKRSNTRLSVADARSYATRSFRLAHSACTGDPLPKGERRFF